MGPRDGIVHAEGEVKKISVFGGVQDTLLHHDMGLHPSPPPFNPHLQYEVDFGVFLWHSITC